MTLENQRSFEECKLEAQGFLETARWCTQDMGYIPDEMKSPFVVNISFALELFFKAIIIKENEDSCFPKVHDLHKLYINLSKHTQEKLKTEYEKGSENSFNKDLEEYLKKCSNYFVEWRYAFASNKSLNANGSDLLRLADVLEKYVGLSESSL